MLFLRCQGHRIIGLIVTAGATLLAGCSGSKTAGYQGYVEGEYVNVASPIAGRLDKLSVQRGQTVEAKAPLFSLEAEQEVAAKQQADEQFNAAQAQLADLKGAPQARSGGHAGAARASQGRTAAGGAATQARRGAIQCRRYRERPARGFRANQAIKAARVRELEGQLDVTRLPAREDLIRAQSAQVAATRAAQSQAAWRLEQKQPAASQTALVSDTLYRQGEWVAAGSPVVRLLPPAM